MVWRSPSDVAGMDNPLVFDDARGWGSRPVGHLSGGGRLAVHHRVGGQMARACQFVCQTDGLGLVQGHVLRENRLMEESLADADERLECAGRRSAPKTNESLTTHFLVIW